MRNYKHPRGCCKAAISKPKPVSRKAEVDLREQLVNEGEVGPIATVSLPEANITALRGIMVDLDPKLLDGGIASKATKSDPARLYRKVVRPWLQRHPVLAKAQVRNSGTGLHVLLLLDKPIVFTGEAQRQRWALIIKVVQRVLPGDPSAPGITAMTRPLGSVNGKNGTKVTLLQKGETVTAEEVLAVADKLRTAPFRTVARVLFDAERISPCPICRKEGTSLAAMDRMGKCYGACGSVQLSQIFDEFYRRRAAGREA